MSKVIISGYYGFNNSGDEAILYAIIMKLRKIDPETEITVLSNQPAATANMYKVAAVDRWKWLRILRALAGCDLLISGGGSLLQDVSSKNSPLYYLAVIAMARLLGKKVMVYAQGIGPLKNMRNRRLAAWILNRVNTITIREVGSKNELEALGVKIPFEVTADPVLGLSRENVDRELGRQILERNGIHLGEEEKSLGVFIRPWGDNVYTAGLAEALNNLAEQGWRVVFVPMQYPRDISAAEETARLLSQGAAVFREEYSPEETLALIENFTVILGMRLHALIDAAVLGKPLIGLSYDPKIDRFMGQLGQASLISAADLRPQTLVEVINWAYDQRTLLSSEILDKAKPLYQKAWRNARIVFELLGK